MREARRLRLQLAAVFLAYAAHATYWVLQGALNVDEGFYALAAREVWTGRLPYRDFAYTQAPLFPYLQGLPLRLTGFGLYEQRALNAVWGGLTLALLVALTRPAHRLRAGWVALALAALPAWVYFEVLGKTYALTGLLVLLAVASLRVRDPRARALAFGLAGSLAVGCRLTVAPAVAVLWVLLLRQAPSRPARRWAALVPPLLGSALAAPFVLADPEGFWFWNLGLHLHVQLAQREHALWDLRSHLPSLLGILGVALVAAGRRRWAILRAEGGLLAAAGVGLLVQLAPSGTYAEYVTPLLPLLALGVARVAQRGLRQRWSGVALTLALVVPLLMHPANFGPEPALLRSLRRAAAYLRASSAPGATVLTCYPIVTAEAGLNAYPRNELGFHSVTCELPAERAHRLEILTYDELFAVAREQRADAIVLAVHWPNFVISIPSCDRIPRARHDALLQAMLGRYGVTWADDEVWVLRPR